MRPRRKQETKYIVWHCSATPPSKEGIGAAAIDRMHKDRGWKGIGYHFVIKRDGKIEIGEHPYNRGAHVKGINDQSVGVCLVGGVDEGGDPESNFTEAQKDSAFALAEVLLHMFPGAEHKGHRDFSPDLDGDGEVDSWEWIKNCPVFSANETFNTGVWTVDPVDELVFEESIEDILEAEEDEPHDNLDSLIDSWSASPLPEEGSGSEEDEKN